MAFDSCSSKSVDCVSTVMVIVVYLPTAELPTIEVVAIGIVAETLSYFSIYFRSDSISISIL